MTLEYYRIRLINTGIIPLKEAILYPHLLFRLIEIEEGRITINKEYRHTSNGVNTIG